MRILINGAWRETGAVQLAAVLDELGYGDAVIATAVNGEFVPSERRPATRIGDGDRVEILAPIQGG